MRNTVSAVVSATGRTPLERISSNHITMNGMNGGTTSLGYRTGGGGSVKGGNGGGGGRYGYGRK